MQDRGCGHSGVPPHHAAFQVNVPAYPVIPQQDAAVNNRARLDGAPGADGAGSQNHHVFPQGNPLADDHRTMQAAGWAEGRLGIGGPVEFLERFGELHPAQQHVLVGEEKIVDGGDAAAIALNLPHRAGSPVLIKGGEDLLFEIKILPLRNGLQNGRLAEVEAGGPQDAAPFLGGMNPMNRPDLVGGPHLQPLHFPGEPPAGTERRP